MSKKLKNEELKNVSGGGCGDKGNNSSQQEQTYYCSDCKKTYTNSETIHKCVSDDLWGEIKCPDCGKVIGQFQQDN